MMQHSSPKVIQTEAHNIGAGSQLEKTRPRLAATGSGNGDPGHLAGEGCNVEVQGLAYEGDGNVREAAGDITADCTNRSL